MEKRSQKSPHPKQKVRNEGHILIMCNQLTHENLVHDYPFIGRSEPQNLLFPAFAGQLDTLHGLVPKHILLPFLASPLGAVIDSAVLFPIKRNLDRKMLAIDGMGGQQVQFDGQ